jgi:hypothetical protein
VEQNRDEQAASSITVTKTESARERDLDHLLMEEIYSNDDFRSWIIKQAPSFKPDEPASIAAYRATRRQVDMRETDLRFEYLDPEDRCRAILLIENKVTADFQPGQAESYRAEATALRAEYGEQNAISILVAPAHYKARTDVKNFDAFISIEDIEAALSRSRSTPTLEEAERRQQIKLAIIRQLMGRRAPRGATRGLPRGGEWEPVAVSKKRVFSSKYSDLVKQLAPGFEVSPSSEGPNARTKIFSSFPGKNDTVLDVRLRHEFGRPDLEETKYVNLQISDAAARLPDLEAHQELFPDDGSIYLAPAGKSLSIRIDTPSIQPDGERFESEASKVVEGINALKKLVDWLKVNRMALEDILAKP